MIVITFGTFDLFHIGHLKIIKRCKELGDSLILGISSDEFSYKKKKRYPIVNQENRKEILESIKYVDKVFFEESMEKKRDYILKYKADILVMGDDWKGKFDEFKDICQVVYLPRTPCVSTTEMIEIIKEL